MPKKSPIDTADAEVESAPVEVPPVKLGEQVRYVLSDRSPNKGQIRPAIVTSISESGVGLNVLVGHRNDFKVGNNVPSVPFNGIPVVIPSFFMDTANYDSGKSAGTWHRDGE